MKKYAAEAQLNAFTMKNASFILNENHSYRQHKPRSITISSNFIFKKKHKTQLLPERLVI